MIQLRHSLDSALTHTGANDRGGDGVGRRVPHSHPAEQARRDRAEVDEEVGARLPGERDAVHFARGDGAAGGVGGAFFAGDEAGGASEGAVLRGYVLGCLGAAVEVRWSGRPGEEFADGVVGGAIKAEG